MEGVAGTHQQASPVLYQQRCTAAAESAPDTRPIPFAALKAGPQSSSAMCAALLEAAGILPDAQGRRIGVQGEPRQGAAGAAEGAAAGGMAGGTAGIDSAAGGMAGSGSAAAVRYLHARRQLYDAMEAALLERGLALGGCCRASYPVCVCATGRTGASAAGI